MAVCLCMNVCVCYTKYMTVINASKLVLIELKRASSVVANRSHNRNIIDIIFLSFASSLFECLVIGA